MLAKLLPIIEGLLLNQVMNSGMLVSRRSKAGGALLVLSGLFFLVALIFGVIAAYQWLLAHYPADMAALLAGTFVLAVSASLAAIGLTILNRRQSRFKEMKEELTHHVSAVYDAVAEELDDPIRNHPKTTIALAALAGYILADRIL